MYVYVILVKQMCVHIKWDDKYSCVMMSANPAVSFTPSPLPTPTIAHCWHLLNAVTVGGTHCIHDTLDTRSCRIACPVQEVMWDGIG